jgi:hypothetical protein
MVRLARGPDGAYRARKRLPDDVREEYGRLYRARHEAKFFRPASAKPHEAKRDFGEWLAEVESRVDTIRKQRKGEGVALTRRQARALAGEWYDWFIARHPLSDKETWEQLRDDVDEALRRAVGEARWEAAEDPDDLYREDDDVRMAIRPILADAGETAQFLAMKGIVLDNEARGQFLDFLYNDLAHALKYLSYSRSLVRRRCQIASHPNLTCAAQRPPKINNSASPNRNGQPGWELNATPSHK